MSESEYRELCGLVRAVDLSVMRLREARPDALDDSGAQFYAALQELRRFVAGHEAQYPTVYADHYLGCEHTRPQTH